MKNVMIVVVLFSAFLFTSCSELTQEQTLVGFPLEKTSKTLSSNDELNQFAAFQPIPIKDWKVSESKEGIDVIFGCEMQELDFVHVVVERSQLNESELIFLQRVNEIVYLPISANEIKAIRAYGIYNSAVDNGVYPFNYLQNFSNLKVVAWEDGGSAMKVAASEWNASSRDLFAEIISGTESLLVFVGNPESNVFELPKYGIKHVDGLNLFASIKNVDLPYDTN